MGPFNPSVYKMFPRLPAAPTWQSQTNLSPINIVEYDLMGNNFGLPFWQAGSPELVQAKSWKCKYYSDWSLAIITADITEGGQSVLAWASPIKTPDNINNISTQISWPSSLPKKDQVKRFLPRLKTIFTQTKKYQYKSVLAKPMPFLHPNASLLWSLFIDSSYLSTEARWCERETRTPRWSHPDSAPWPPRRGSCTWWAEES